MPSEKIQQIFKDDDSVSLLEVQLMTGSGFNECEKVYLDLLNDSEIRPRPVARMKREVIAQKLIGDSQMTYNQVTDDKQSGKSVYFNLLDYGLIKKRGYSHNTENRKKRTKITPNIRNRVLKCFLNNPSFSITQVAKKVKLSHGAVISMHDLFVKDGEMVTRRDVMTSVANKPPLYLLKEEFLKLVKDNPKMDFHEILKISPLCEMTCKKIHDILVAEGEIKSIYINDIALSINNDIIEIYNDEFYKTSHPIKALHNISKEYGISYSRASKIKDILVKNGLFD